MQVQIQALSSTHNCKGFDCGTPPLNKWLVEMANQQQKKNIARTFVLVDDSAPETVLGFYTLTVSEVSRDELPNPNKYPNRVPVVRLGRFATHTTLQGQSFGEYLLFNALERVVEISLNAGIAAIVVDAKDTKAVDFYRRYDFLSSPDNPLQLFLLTKALQAAVHQATPKSEP
ncbi:MAG: GNAT family N-acetyltransferase [Betaproteobacteria bacterium HGW-Betaproteobacteria-10]|jgi:predicted GNAT family N-acyltransferase|nr:MAG: GNAT family N-acetyltransferase [Betaproteobacteria bacterium HGW-Betaproteobacteria-10]